MAEEQVTGTCTRHVFGLQKGAVCNVALLWGQQTWENDWEDHAQLTGSLERSQTLCMLGH
jgi:hypothetical protein